MLELKGITKTYFSSDERIPALRGIDINFRKNEFVSILGPSGCGKTTLLNIIGGLDKYSTGDLVINGKSTKDFTDADWDSYRNHSIGFVFQSYNLISHQTVLSNVELALTLSGVSGAERRKRAVDALKKVGLEDQLKKKPNQMSGGQMQRVAIARALVNDPDILLADEPTGALDTNTSEQIMDILKEIAKDRLVIMVTHNPELAERYSTRIIRLLDGKVTDDSDPAESSEMRREMPKFKKTSMSFMTALSLSLNNLMTKKGRTILTAFAGSIGIIGIALILSLSNGINNYINKVQEDTLSSYPISINAENLDMSSMITTLMGATDPGKLKHDRDAVYSSSIMYELMNSLTNAEVERNNLTLFKEFLDSNGGGIEDYAAKISYGYKLDINIFAKDTTGKVIKSDIAELMKTMSSQMGMSMDLGMGTENQSSGFSGVRIWQEMLSGENGELVNPLVKEQYDLIYGAWPQSKDEVVLIVNENNEISDMALYCLGLKSMDEMMEELKAAARKEELSTESKRWTYDEILNMTFRLIPSVSLYQKNTDGSYSLLTDTETGTNYLYTSSLGTTLRVTGIIRINPDTVGGSLNGAIGYTAALKDYLIEEAANSDIVKKQLEDKTTDVILNLPFKTENETVYTDSEKAEMIKEYFAGLSDKKKAEIYAKILSAPSDDYLAAAVAQATKDMTREMIEMQIIQAYSAKAEEGSDVSYISDYIKNMTDEELFAAAEAMIRESAAAEYAKGVEKTLSSYSQEQIAGMFTAKLNATGQQGFSETEYAAFFDEYMPATVSESTLENNLKKLGYVNKKNPDTVTIYAKTFNDKDKIAEIIAAYNDTKAKDDKIAYTDYVALLMSSVSTIINAISYVLVAFVAISLVVSSIMIGIITYISVLERTKEIGILRAIGASKHDVSRVFNAETLIEGFAAGAIGIGMTLLLTIPINIIVHKLTEISAINAELPVVAGIVLVVISMVLTFIAGLIPSSFAAKKDPVIALRTE